jgi:hypothetical protein
MLPIEYTTYQAIQNVLESKEVITDQLLESILLTAGIEDSSDPLQRTYFVLNKFMLNRFLFATRFNQLYSYQPNDPGINLIVQMIYLQHKS